MLMQNYLLQVLLLLLCSLQFSHAFLSPLSWRHSPSQPSRASSLFLEPPASSSSSTPPFTVTSSDDDTIHTLTFHSIPGQNNNCSETVLQTGKIGRLAAGAIEYRRGDTVVYSTASYESDVNPNIDFVPLSIEYQERFSSAGLTSGAFNKREGRPTEHEILTSRLIDRPLRPLFPAGWRHETQVLSWVLSYDGERSCAPASIVAAAAATYIARDIPLAAPVAAVQVGFDSATGVFMVNPTHAEMATSRLLLTVAGTEDAVLMIEGEADFLPESVFLDAVRFGHAAVRVFCQGIQALADVVGNENRYDTIQQAPENLQERVNELMTERVDEMYAASGTKQEKGALMNKVQMAALAEIQAEFDGVSESLVLAAFKNLLKNRMFVRAKETGLRGDGRKVDQVRKLSMETSILPRVHGSALFTRGETQAIATATLGDAGMRQKVDSISGMATKRFYLQYTFPPSCVGETGRVGAPGRREVGHGNLAERALVPTLPSEADFPYAIRVESLITESHGSSSMASVCGGCLALMDAGVPLKQPVAGIAMGMLLGEDDKHSMEDAIVLTDITGTEDALGMMDFKVAGDREGITTFQLDIKCEGLTIEVMERALEQARIGRLAILDEMDKAVQTSSSALPSTVPRIRSFSIPSESLGKVIGPGGRQIRSIIEDFGLINMDVGEDGTIQLSSLNDDQLPKAEEFVKNLVTASAGGGGGGGRNRPPPYAGEPPVEGEIYTGKIKGIHPFGVFVEIIPPPEDGSTAGLEALCHVSELANDNVRNCEGFMRSMNVEEITVKYLGLEAKGKHKVSRKAALGKPAKKANKAKSPVAPKTPVSNDMDKAELDVIAQAIEDAA